MVINKMNNSNIICCKLSAYGGSGGHGGNGGDGGKYSFKRFTNTKCE